MSPVSAWFAAAAVGLLSGWVRAGGLLGNLEDETVARQPVKLTVNSFKMCPDHLDVPSTYDNLSLYMDPELGHTLFVDGVLNMREEIPDDTLLIVDVRRCYDEREVSCEKYYLHEVQGVCSYIDKDNEMWTEFVKAIQGLEAKCPIKPGSYQLDEAPVDLSKYQNHSEFVGHWQSEFSFARPPKLYGCILLDVTISLR